LKKKDQSPEKTGRYIDVELRLSGFISLSFEIGLPEQVPLHRLKCASKGQKSMGFYHLRHRCNHEIGTAWRSLFTITQMFIFTIILLKT